MRVEERPQIRAERVPPHNLQAEESVLGSMMLSAEAIADVIEHLKPDDFYRSAHTIVYNAILRIYGRGEPVDVITTVEELKREGKLEEIGGPLYVHELVQNVATPASATHYARIVGENALLRRLIRAASQIMELGYSSQGDPEDAADQAEEMIYRVARHHEKDEVVPMSVLVDTAMSDLEKFEQRESAFAGVPTAFTDLDKLTAGLQAGNLIVVAARPGVGKSSFVTNLARNVAVDAQTAVAMFSLEMSRWEIGMRLLCAEARVPWDRIRSGHPSPDDWSRIVEAAEVLHEAPLFIVDAGNVNIVEIRAKARRLRQRANLGLIIVDYLQLMSTPGRVESRQQEIADISRNLKLLAKELELPVIAVSQLNREPERRQDKRPQLSDLRECVTGDTLVCLADGRRVPIRDLVGTTPEVLSVSAEGRLVVAHADRVWLVGRKPVFTVRLASGRTMRVTARHRLLSDAGWVRVHDLSAGDRLALARRLPEPADAGRWPDQRLMVLGHLLAGGDLTASPIRYRTTVQAHAQVVAAAAERGFGVEATWQQGRFVAFEGDGRREEFEDWLRDLRILGRGRRDLRVPQSVYQLRDEQVAMLLRHLWADAGAIESTAMGGRPSGQVWVSLPTRELAEDVAALLLRLGVMAELRDEVAGAADRHEVVVARPEEQARFLERVGAFGAQVAAAEQLALVLTSMAEVTVGSMPREIFSASGGTNGGAASGGISQRMNAALRGASGPDTAPQPWHPSRGGAVGRLPGNGGGSGGRKGRAQDLYWDAVASVEIAGEEEVFDLSVPGPESWLADGLVSHNSGAIEQDADIVMFIHREDSEDPSVKGTADLLIAKHRNGPTGVVRLTFLPQYTQFRNYAPPATAGP